MRASILSAFLAFAIAGCGVFDDRSSSIIVYGRNAREADAWFALMPGPASGGAVGFGRDIGVACLTGSATADLVWLSGSPTTGGSPVQVVSKVANAAAMEAGAIASVWVDVQPDGSLLSGDGVPAWWPDAPPAAEAGQVRSALASDVVNDAAANLASARLRVRTAIA